MWKLPVTILLWEMAIFGAIAPIAISLWAFGAVKEGVKKAFREAKGG